MGKMADLLVAILEFPVILYAFPIAISWKLAMDVKLVIERGAKNKQTLNLRSEQTIVGRRDGCDLRIPSAAVSRRPVAVMESVRCRRERGATRMSGLDC